MQLNQNNVLCLIQVNHILEFWIGGKDLKEKKQKRKELMQCNKFQFLNIEIATETNTCTSNFMLSYTKENSSAPKFPVLYFHKLVHLYSLSKGSKLKSQQQPKRHQWVIKQTNKNTQRLLVFIEVGISIKISILCHVRYNVCYERNIVIVSFENNNKNARRIVNIEYGQE